MGQFYNHKILLLFLGGAISLFLTITIICVKQLYKRELERKRLSEESKVNPEKVGDIEAKLDDSSNFKKPNILEEMVNWSIQPLLIISFLSLLDQSNEIQIFITFFLVILTLVHEFYLGDKFSSHIYYQGAIFLLWILMFGLISYKANSMDEVQKDKSIGTEQKSASVDSTLKANNKVQKTIP